MSSTGGPMAERGIGRKLKVFISYSRKDIVFANGLAASLNKAGFDPLVDRESIEPGEPWQQRLAHLLVQADAVVFIISPDSVRSPHCVWETDEAERLSKRLLPIAYRPVDGHLIYKRLSRLNWIDLQAVAVSIPLATAADGQ